MKSKVYSCDIRIAGTVYVRAKTLKQAKELIAAIYGNALHVSEGEYEDVIISGARLDDPELPEISLSPCFTVHNPWSPVKLVHEDEDD